MLKIDFSNGALNVRQQEELNAGFKSHGQIQCAPTYQTERLNWTVTNEQGGLIAALTADLLWQWLYVDELWVDESCRGKGIGKQLMMQAETYAKEQQLAGLWLWTQSWQAPLFYQNLGFKEFTRFDNFPSGYSRIGLRKQLS
ncbi:GNAT family N-acetyltransferase [Shewanella marinintestina]|uniref:GNAT family N-acetyltransferase n=1 Tax=Shewanella marinintestina TaxID=190305 RepID=UPI00200E0627|nr:GNAT family N-acetyltransferase [Shewanella marinintestina]MCL1145762.1 GNAT family N-acetyltransferase [Shewanella marinintestina]